MSDLDRWLEPFVRAGADLGLAGLVPVGGGNLSVWTPEGVVITREGAPLHRLTAADLLQIVRTTEPPPAMPSADTPIHRAIYVLGGAGAVVHAHPPHALALAATADRIVPDDVRGRRLFGAVPVVASVRNIVEEVGRALVESPVVLVRNDGSYARARTLDDAVALTAALEWSARLQSLTAARRA